MMNLKYRKYTYIQKQLFLFFIKFYFKITSTSQVFANFTKAKITFSSQLAQLAQQQSQIPQLLQNNAIKLLFSLLADKEQKIVLNSLIALVNLCKYSKQAEQEILNNIQLIIDFLKETDNFKIKTYLIKIISQLDIQLQQDVAQIIVDSCISPHTILQQESCQAIKQLGQNESNASVFIQCNAINILLQVQQSTYNQISNQAMDALSQLIRQTGQYQQIIEYLPQLTKNDSGVYNILSAIAEINQDSCQQLLQIPNLLQQIIQGCQQEIISAWQTLQNISRYCPQEVVNYGIQSLLIDGLENSKYQIVTASLLIIGFISSLSIQNLLSIDVCERILRIFEVNIDIELIVAAASFAISQLSKASQDAADIFVQNGLLMKFYQIRKTNENLQSTVYRTIQQLIKQTTCLDDVCQLLYQVSEQELQKDSLQQIYRILQLNVENRRNFLKQGYLEFINKNFQLQDIEQINKLYSQDVVNYCRKDLCDLIEQVQ